jgi:squalene-hopene/tetraprenyl-beta-curcumene cyclase
MVKQQQLGGDLYSGGMADDPETGRPYTDLSNSYIAYEAFRLTEQVEDLRGSGEPKADLDWDAAVKFLSRIQNLPEENDQAWANEDPEEKGGFIYRPDFSQAGARTNEAGEVTFRTYASMTYAGLLSLIYADVDRDDKRVKSAFEWAARHWSLEENPGMGLQGLYYFYNVLAKALAVYGQDVLVTPEEQRINWREAYVRKLVNLQKIENGLGYWVNEAGRWWEKDPVLVTAYALIGLEVALAD